MAELMTRVLNSRERTALKKLFFDHDTFHVKGELVGIGEITLQSLVDLGLVEVGHSKRFGQTGWRCASDAWICMYGETREEIEGALGTGRQFHELRVWEWPPRKA